MNLLAVGRDLIFKVRTDSRKRSMAFGQTLNSLNAGGGVGGAVAVPHLPSHKSGRTPAPDD